MKLLIDESVDRPIIDRLIDHGYDVLSIADVDPGITDAVVLQRANELSALLVTSDKDFGELVFQRISSASSGVVLNSSKWSIGSAQSRDCNQGVSRMREPFHAKFQCHWTRQGKNSN